jgi:L-iditol 2-dehydrogenase
VKTARFFGPRDIRIIETEMPSMGDDEVLLRVHVCGICGGDSRQYLSATQIQDVAPGHEIGAEVWQVGKAVKVLNKGDAVCVEPWVFCGKCEDCLKGETNHCEHRQFMSYHLPGGFSEYITAPAHVVYKMPAGTSYETCLLVEPLSVGVHAVRRCGIKSGETVVVLGLGSIGLSAIVATKHLGAGKIICSAKYPHQAELAKKLGADVVVGSQRDEVMDAVLSNTKRGADMAIIASMGVPIGLGVDALRNGGRMALYVAPQNLEDFSKAIGKEIVMYGCDAYAAMDGKRDYEVAMEILLSGKMEFNSIVTHRFPLTQVRDAFEVSASRYDGAVKVLVTF